MLPSPRDVVIGASDLGAVASFLALFGFAEVARDRLPQPCASALYGLETATDELLLAVPGAERGRVRVVATANPARRFAPFDPRPFAIDLFSTDVEAGVAIASANGFHASPITDHRFGPAVIREVEVIGPDGIVLTLLQPNVGRRSSILDHEPDRLHSEVHAFVWSESGLDEHLRFWQERGLTKSTDAVLDTPGLGALVGVPDEDVSMRLTVLAGAEGHPIRVEFVDFLGRSGSPQPIWPLAAGLYAPAFEVEDLEAAAARLAPAVVDPPVTVATAVHPGVRAAHAVSPGGHHFELWERG